MLNFKTVRDIDVRGKKVFLRVDFNVPLENKNITNDKRIRESLPTIIFLVTQGAKVIIASHLGRPKGEVRPELRLRPVAERLGELLDKNVHYTEEVVSGYVCDQVNQLDEGEILLLENIRFEPGEERNDSQFAQALAGLADIYVNDAFGAAHRAHASTVGIAKFLPAVAGFLLEKELLFLSKALDQPQSPFTAIIGGAKVKDKIGVIENLLAKVDHLLIGGGLSYTFLKAKGYEIGQSLCEMDKLDIARDIIKLAEEKGVQLLLPLDAVVSKEFRADAEGTVVASEDIPGDQQALDIGPKTVEAFAQIIRASKTVIWNGPMGVSEWESFAQGTIGVAEAVAVVDGTTIVGGGDSIAALDKTGLSQQITHVSTGGGASLEFLEGKVLPGVAILEKKG